MKAIVKDKIESIRIGMNRKCNRMSIRLNVGLENVIYNEIYRLVAARVAYPILISVSDDPHKEGPFI